MPLLLLLDDEAVAIATGLITAARTAVFERAALRGRGSSKKLPNRLRQRVATVADTASWTCAPRTC
jgi:hypothetical protein